METINEETSREYEEVVNDYNKYFPVVSIKGRKYSSKYIDGDYRFIYNTENATLVCIFRTPEEIDALGKKKAPWRVLDAAGLSRGEWNDNPQYWVDFYASRLKENFDNIYSKER